MMEISATRPEPLHKSVWHKYKLISWTALPPRRYSSPLNDVNCEGIVGNGAQVLTTASPARNCTWNESLCLDVLLDEMWFFK